MQYSLQYATTIRPFLNTGSPFTLFSQKCLSRFRASLYFSRHVVTLELVVKYCTYYRMLDQCRVESIPTKRQYMLRVYQILPSTKKSDRMSNQNVSASAHHKAAVD